MFFFTALCCWVWGESFQCWKPGCQSSQTVSPSYNSYNNVVYRPAMIYLYHFAFYSTIIKISLCSQWSNVNHIWISQQWHVLFSSSTIRSSVRLMIRKVQYAPETLGPAPCVETTRDFLMSDKPLHMEASLQKQVGFKQTTSRACMHHNLSFFGVIINVSYCFLNEECPLEYN